MKLTPQDFVNLQDRFVTVGSRAARGQRRLTRRGFLAAGGLTGVAAAASALVPVVAHGEDDDSGHGLSVVDPRPIPQTLPGMPFHLQPTGHGFEPSTITDFDGVVGRAQIGGTGTGFSSSGAEDLLFDTDLGFMQGRYVGVDDRIHHGTFLFV